MKILTLNVHCGKELANPNVYNAFLHKIKKEEIDLLLLQEVTQSLSAPIVSNHYQEAIREDNFAHKLSEDLSREDNTWDYFYSASHIGFDVFEEGLAIISRLPFHTLKVDYVSRSQSMEFWKSRKVISIRLNDYPITIATGHFGWQEDDEEPFEEQWKRTLSILDENTLIGGDFNNEPASKSYQQIIESGFTDLHESNDDNATFYADVSQASIEKDNVGKCIDYLFTNSDKIKVKASKRIFAKDIDALRVSDHCGILIDVEVDDDEE